jgi:hypothetical protein
MGRPTKLTPEMQKKLCDVLAAGATRQDAAYHAGLRVQTLYDWLKRGRAAQSGLFREFSDAVKAAEAQCAIRCAAVIQRAAQGSAEAPPEWKAACWWLERRRPKQFGPRLKADLSGTIEIVLARMGSGQTLLGIKDGT